ncbi:MAG TPA: DUF4058 family protein [Pirellulales bacterium]|nr:DUF4058 family protein [Pirellulales bacterium]
MIFPGMDPYLEASGLWTGLHNSLIHYIRDQLRPALRPRYVARTDERVFVEGPQREIVPDVLVKHGSSKSAARTAFIEADEPVIVRVAELEIRESFVEIRDRQTGQNIVTIIEVASPWNKFPGHGRKSYKSKQRAILASATHLVEIDLLRRGHHVLAVPELQASDYRPYDYLACVTRAAPQRYEYELYPRRLREPLPKIRIPLAGDDADVVLDVQAALEQAYEMGDYQDDLRYDLPCQPPLPPENQEWAAEQIARAASG